MDIGAGRYAIEVPAYAMVQIAQNYAYRSDLNFKVWNQASLYCADLKIG